MKRSSVLLQLSREHHTALVLALHIARANDLAAQSALLLKVPAIFEKELAPHFLDEEADLLPRLAAVGETALVNRTLDEHRQMHGLVEKIAAGDLASLQPFGVLLKAHVQFEERQLFVTAQSLLPADYLDRHV